MSNVEAADQGLASGSSEMMRPPSPEIPLPPPPPGSWVPDDEVLASIQQRSNSPSRFLYPFDNSVVASGSDSAECPETEQDDYEWDATGLPEPPVFIPVQSNTSPVYLQRLQRRLPRWQAFASVFILGWIANGVPVEFTSEPPPHVRPSNIRGRDELFFAREQVSLLLQGGCIGVDPTATVICPLGVAPKKGSARFRLIHNLRFVNRFCKPKPFKYESLIDLQSVLKPGMWMTKLDLKSGYHHIPLRPEQRRFFGFEFEGVVYTWRQLFFGLAPAPYIFTMIMREICKKWRFLGMILLHYMDDIAVFASTAELCAQQTAIILADLEALGFIVNLEKSVTTPVQTMEFLGYEISTVGVPTFRVPPHRIARLRDMLDFLARTTGSIPVRTIASVTGQVLSMSLALAPARLFTRALYRVINASQRDVLPGGWNATVNLTQAAREEIAFWLRGLDRWNGLPVFREPGVRVIDVVSDASHIHGWGGWAWNPLCLTKLAIDATAVRTFDCQGRWTIVEREEHINLQELRAFYYTLLALQGKLPQGARLRPRLDNTTALAYLNNGGGRLRLFTELVKNIWLLCIEKGWLLERGVHILGVLNTRADWLSRNFASCDWKLNPDVFNWLDGLWGPHEHDRCASRVNRQNNLPFDSLYHEPGAAGVDTFTQWWRPTNNWVNGSFAQIGRLLALCRAQKACATFIAPRWARWWWKELCDACVDWRELPRCHDLFLPGNHANARGVGLPPWRIFAFRLDFRQEATAWRERVQRLPWYARHT